LSSGDDIPIEERDESEVSGMWGFNDFGHFTRVQIAPAESACYNQAFDVTDAKYITGIITEDGIKKPNKLF